MTAAGDPSLEDVLDPSYLESLEERSAEELRSRLAAARSYEEELSYCRRLLHGRLDLLRAELSPGGSRAATSGAETLSEQLAAVLTTAEGGAGTGSRGARARGAPPPTTPRTATRRHVEALLQDIGLQADPGSGGKGASKAVERLLAAEKQVSEERRRLHGVIDALEGELVDRYKSGKTSPTDLLGDARSS